MNKKTFSLIELIFVITLIAIISSYSNYKNNQNRLILAKNQIIMHLKYMRYIAMLDNKYEHDNDLWFRKAWNMKFLNCQKKIGGIYYVVYSNTINSGHWAISKEETLKDPLNNNHIYSNQCKKDELYDKSKFVLLSEYYGIKDIKISCNYTGSLGQILFLNDGGAYSKFDENINEYKIINNCTISLIGDNNEQEDIIIEANTGYIY